MGQKLYPCIMNGHIYAYRHCKNKVYRSLFAGLLEAIKYIYCIHIVYLSRIILAYIRNKHAAEWLTCIGLVRFLCCLLCDVSDYPGVLTCCTSPPPRTRPPRLPPPPRRHAPPAHTPDGLDNLFTAPRSQKKFMRVN